MTTCVVCGASAPLNQWRLFMPFQTYSARAGHLCDEHINISREEFHAACIALQENADIKAYTERNRKQLEKEQRGPKRGASPETLAKMHAAKAANRAALKTETAQIQEIGASQASTAISGPNAPQVKRRGARR